MKPRKLYTCFTTWHYEAGQVEVLFFKSKKALEQVMKCTAECGIVEVTAKLITKPKARSETL